MARACAWDTTADEPRSMLISKIRMVVNAVVACQLQSHIFVYFTLLVAVPRVVVHGGRPWNERPSYMPPGQCMAESTKLHHQPKLPATLIRAFTQIISIGWCWLCAFSSTPWKWRVCLDQCLWVKRLPPKVECCWCHSMQCSSLVQFNCVDTTPTLCTVRKLQAAPGWKQLNCHRQNRCFARRSPQNFCSFTLVH